MAIGKNILGLIMVTDSPLIIVKFIWNNKGIDFVDLLVSRIRTSISIQI
jgi:hypothetical protein